MAGAPSRTIAVIDDDESVRRALTRRLRAAGHMVEAFASAAEFMAQRSSLGIGAVVTDLQMPGMSGLELQSTLARDGDAVAFVFISAHGDLDAGVTAMRGGAVHFLAKPFADDDLLRALDEALACTATRTQANAAHAAATRAYAGLTPRERDVFALVVEGLMNKRIADRLGIAEKTVKIHRARVMEKMGVERLADLVRLGEALADGASRPRTAAVAAPPPDPHTQ